MTTDVRRFYSPDLFVPNEAIRFDCDRATEVHFSGELAAITFDLSLPDAATKRPHMIEEICREVAVLIFENPEFSCHRVILFACLGPWQPATAVTRKKGLFGGRPELPKITGKARPASECEFVSVEGIRFAGVMEIDRQHLAAAADFCRRDMDCMLMVSRRQELVGEAGVRQLFDAAFPPNERGIPQGSVDWLTASTALVPLGDILMRVTGSFDDREVAVDLIGDPNSLKTLL